MLNSAPTWAVAFVLVQGLSIHAAVAVDSCSSRHRQFNDVAYGGSGYTLLGCSALPEGMWQQMEQESKKECTDQ
ncbi:MAG: hypothetical protein K1X79_13830, partial [Oligoflexia bacterium]|nr:hypothetical protein [Oligoflexia bacterium]